MYLTYLHQELFARYGDTRIFQQFNHDFCTTAILKSEAANIFLGSLTPELILWYVHLCMPILRRSFEVGIGVADRRQSKKRRYKRTESKSLKVLSDFKARNVTTIFVSSRELSYILDYINRL